jgi:glycolate oxidase FAD binding subunit
LRPETGEEAAAALKALGAEGRTVRPGGGGTKPWGPVAPDAVDIETGGLNRIVEHNVGDFTAVLEAGVPLAEAQEKFAAEGQMLAIDPSLGEASAATMGGVMASNDSGPLRHRYGGVRELVVGTTVALSDGTLASSGGRVIKNVAGYDLGKLFTGSFGTLGLIVRVAVRLHPLATGTASVTGGSDDPGRLGAAAVLLAGEPLEADSLDIAWRDGGGQLLVRFSGATAAERAAACGERMRAAGLEEIAVVEDDDELWMAQRVAQRGDCVLKVSGRITDLPAVCRTGARVVGRAGAGLYWLAIEPEPERVAELREALAPRSCVLLDAPLALRSESWPEAAPGAVALMARVKERFDPARIFRPQTFVGGI